MSWKVAFLKSEREFVDLFVFAVPLLPQRRARDWSRVLDNLQATLQSILNQTDRNFHCLLAVEDSIPLAEVDSPHITVVNISEAERLDFARDNYNMSNNDAGMKRARLLDRALQLGATYIMFTDADDLVSNKLVGLIRESKPAFGAALRQGFVLDGQAGLCVPVPSRFVPVNGYDTYCGSSIVFTLRNQNFEITVGSSYHNWPLSFWSLGHGQVRQKLIENKTPLLDINEPMGVYVINSGENLSALSSNTDGYRSFLNSVVTNIQTHGRPLSKAQLIEFGLWT
jgi:glycosyltransferase involved in cell wall biosynthesis